MAKLSLQGYVNFLSGLGKTTKQIWTSIKTNDAYKSTTNGNIQKALDAYTNMTDAIKKISQYAPNTKISRASKNVPKGSSDTWEVGFTFQFKTSTHSTERYLSVNVRSDMTKQELLDAMKDAIRDMLNEYYPERNLRGIVPSIRILTLRGA